MFEYFFFDWTVIDCVILLFLYEEDSMERQAECIDHRLDTLPAPAISDYPYHKSIPM